MMTNPNFITLYTDASLKEKATIAFYGKCNLGKIKGKKTVPAEDIQIAELKAVLFAVKESLWLFPKVEGFFINTDNLSICHLFWPFKDVKEKPEYLKIKNDILSIVGDKFIKIKHVKAHTGKNDRRSKTNRYVDRMTR